MMKNVNNSYPKDLSKSPVAAGVFVCGIMAALIAIPSIIIYYRRESKNTTE